MTKINYRWKNLIKKVSGIQSKLIISFAIPILLMAIFGVVSYNKSADSIISNYENIATDTLNATKDYILMGIDSTASRSYDLAGNDKFKFYYKNADDLNTEESKAALSEVKNEVSTAKSSHSFLYAVHAIGEEGSSISTVDTLPEDFHNSFEQSPEGQLITSATGRYIWVGNHSFLDDKLNNKQINYAISIIRKMSENNGYIIMDVATSEISKSITQVNLGEGSIVGFVTKDGYEVLANTEETSVFSELDYCQGISEQTEASGFSYEKFNGDNYLFLYSKVGDTGAALCALVPKNTILKDALAIRRLSIIFVGLACVVAIAIGTLIAGSIGREITKLTKSIAQAAKGDLTVRFDTKRRDEFLVLSNSLTDMIGSMRSLIEQAATVGERVSNSAVVLSNTSSDILRSTKDISLAIDEIGEGVIQQADDTEQCLSQMSDLSERINQVYGSTYEIEKIAEDTKDIVDEGITTMDELNNKSSATTEITHVVIDEIEELEYQSRSIANFIGIINEIAAQTNLLSLNASIEAARAGESGRGFAVVADEIRKLADQSLKAADQITDIVNVIQQKTQGTVTSAKQAESMLQSQMEALSKTVSTFDNINTHVANLVNNLSTISEGVKGIENSKEGTLDAIRNISAVSQQTATSSEEVSATANNQIDSVEYLSKSASELAEDARKLEEAIRLFHIN